MNIYRRKDKQNHNETKKHINMQTNEKIVTQSAKSYSSKRPFTPHVVKRSNKQSPSQANYYFLIQTNSLKEQ